MKIICVGRNYAEHAKEMNQAVPSEPVVFIKPSTALLRIDKPLYYPEFTTNLHYEAELVLRICSNGKYIAPEFASRYYDALTVGIDFTARDLQEQCKQKGLPWEIAKGFDGAAPVGEWMELAQWVDFSAHDVHFSLQKNGATVQTGHSADMLFSFEDIICYVSRYFRLHVGDMIFTGTPVGVGPVAVGDVLEGFIGKRKLLTCEIK